MDGEQTLVQPEFDTARWGKPSSVLSGATASNRDQARELADAVLAHFGLDRTTWRQSGAQEWSAAEFEIPGQSRRERIQISDGGVVSVNGAPFTPDRERANDSFAALEYSMDDLILRVAKVAPMRVLMGHSKLGITPSMDCRWYAMTDFESASALCRAYIARHGLDYGEFKGGELRTPEGKIPGIVAYNGKIWSTNATKLVWEPAGSRVSIPLARRGLSL